MSITLNRVRLGFQVFAILLSNAPMFSATSDGVAEQLLGQLQDDKPAVVQLALYQLGQFGDSLAENEVAKKKIATILRDQRQPEAVREVAAYALGRIGAGAASQIPSLEAALNDKSSKVKRAAAEALGRVGNNRDDVLDYLNKAFQTKDLSVRVACISGFASIEPKEAVINRLSDIMENSEELELKRAAAFALAQMTPNAASAVPALRHALASNDPELRQVSGWVLGLIGPGADPAVPQLITELSDKKDAIRRVAADALGRIGSEDDSVAAALTERLLNDPNLDVKTACATTLGRMGNRPAVASALFKALHAEDDPALMLAAATAISQINPSPNSDVSALIRVGTKGPFADVREAAIRAIGHIHQQSQQAVPALSATLTDPIPTVASAAADALGEFGESASPALPALTKACRAPKLRLASSRAIARIAMSLRDRFEVSPDRHDEKLRRQLNDASSELAQIALDDPAHTDADGVLILAQAVSALDRNIRTFRINEWWKQHKLIGKILVGILIYFAWLMFLYFIALRFFPLSLIGWNQALQRLSFRLPESLGGVTIGLRDLLILDFYRRDRVLEAWVEKNADRAVANFEKQSIRNSRRQICSLPLDINGESHTEPSAAALRKYCDRHRWLLRIVGEGGVGKTTLACQIAFWGLDKDPDARLCPARRMIPIILERGSGLEALKDLAHFNLAIRGQLRDLIGEAKELPAWLCQELSRDQRILVIIDGLSEMDVVSDTPLPLHPEFPVAAIIITSRSESLWDDVSHTDVRPRKIDRDHLLPFMNTYLGKASQKLRDDQVWDACKQLSELVGGAGRSITPLLARLYAEQLANAPNRKNGIAKNIPELVLGYVTTLNRERKSDDPEYVTLHRAAELIAWECCRTTFNAGYASKERVLNAMVAEGGLRPDLFELLEKRLRLVRTIPPAETHIEFVSDPIAEYLAGIWLVQMFQTDKEWMYFLRQAGQAESSPESVSAFLAAVLDCCRHVEHFSGSHSVLQEFQDRIAALQTRETTAQR